MTNNNNILQTLSGSEDSVTIAASWVQDGTNNAYISSFNDQEITLELNSSIVID